MREEAAVGLALHQDRRTLRKVPPGREFSILARFDCGTRSLSGSAMPSSLAATLTLAGASISVIAVAVSARTKPPEA
jgi:hypothetical protein